MNTLLGRPLAVVLFLSLVMGAPALADMVTVAVTGQVTEASDFPTISNGSLITGFYRYDDATPDDHPNAYNGYYADVTFSLTFEDGSTISTDAAHIFINNDSTGIGSMDDYYVTFPDDYSVISSSTTMTGAFAGLGIGNAGIYLIDPSGNALASDALPDPESILASMTRDDSNLFLGTMDPTIRSPWYYLKFEVTDLSVVKVPVPGAFALAILGLGSTGGLLRRRNGST